MDQESRRAAAAAYKERKARAGIYALRCEPSGEVWVGRAPDADAIANRVAFMLRHGRPDNAGLRAALAAHGSEAFTLNLVDTIERAEAGLALDRWLRDRLDHWQAALGAARA